MPDIRPFRALRFSLTRAGNPALVVAPPLEGANAAALASLREQSPHNVAHLLAPDGSLADAAARLRRWIAKGVLQRDTEPALYAYEQTWSGPNGRRTRRGFFGLLRLERERHKVLVPHRLYRDDVSYERLHSLRANVAPVLALYEDPTGEVDATLSTARSAFPDVALTAPDGVEHRLFPVTDPFALQRVAAVLEHRTVLLGDGQSDYEAALELQRNEVQETGTPASGPRDFVLTYFSNSADAGLAVRPYHLVLEGVFGFEFNPFVKALEGWFELEPVKSIRDVQGILDMVEAGGRHGTAFALIGGGSVGRRSGFVARANTLIAEKRLEHLGARSRHRGLDLPILNELVLRDLLGCSFGLDGRALGVDYLDDANEAMVRGRAKTAQLVILRNPPPVPALFSVCQEGGHLPRPIAGFYPHCLSGLVVNDLSRF